MSVLIAIALKSLLVAGLTLALLALMKRRSAAERSWVAHIGLLALIIMAFAPLALPTWNVEAPALLGRAPVAEASATTISPDAKLANAKIDAPAIPPPAASKASTPTISSLAAASAVYAIPAAILLFVTFLALARLITLRARAEVLVDGHWLTALARAQRRMGFKHGTALLTSNALASPISWGLMRPVILLNSRAVEASGEAEAIIAHELAHVARMDWMKLLLARIATALFWFNPLVWMLAREAHQLREETADDAVLAADIPDTDYAQLLVGVARHECPGLLLGAHGVAPSKSSLARRVARVLDGKSVRGPAARSFAVGVFVGAVMVAAPLAALTFTPAGKGAQPKVHNSLAASEPGSAYYPGTGEVPTDLPHMIASGVSTSVATAAAAIAPATGHTAAGDFEATAPTSAKVVRKNGVMIATAPNGASTVIYPPDAHGRSKIVATGPDGATAVTYMNAADLPGMSALNAGRPASKGPIDEAIEMKAAGVTPEYVAAVRSASPRLRHADLDDIVGMRVVGVTPAFIRAMVAAGFGNLDADELTQARAAGVTGEYVRAMSAAGFRGDLEDFIEMRAVGVTPEYASEFKKSGYKVLSAEQLIKMKAHNIRAEDLRGLPPLPPAPPQPPRVDPDDG
jgi:beta-lactamase regulating signal transducer with metallopeptidase domain